MKAFEYWQCFLEPGAPEFYLLYHDALKMERQDVFDRSGAGTQSHGLQ